MRFCSRSMTGYPPFLLGSATTNHRVLRPGEIDQVEYVAFSLAQIRSIEMFSFRKKKEKLTQRNPVKSFTMYRQFKVHRVNIDKTE